LNYNTFKPFTESLLGSCNCYGSETEGGEKCIISDAEQTTEGLAAQREAFDFDELFGKVMVIETGIGNARQFQNAGAHRFGQPAAAGSPATGVCQSGCAAQPVASLEAFHGQFRTNGSVAGCCPQAGMPNPRFHQVATYAILLRY
jgi:hypothetical protein